MGFNKFKPKIKNKRKKEEEEETHVWFGEAVPFQNCKHEQSFFGKEYIKISIKKTNTQKKDQKMK